MKTRAVVAGGLLALAGVWAISAVGQSMLITPAEFPPASFEGREYVDSNGCVFIRAGVDGATTWVPRVTRDRNAVCGLDPTFTAQQLASLSAPMATPAVTEVAMAAEPMVMAEPIATPIARPIRTVASDPNVVNDIFVGGRLGAGAASPSSSIAYVAPTSASVSTVATTIGGPVVTETFVAADNANAIATPAFTGTSTGTFVPLSVGIPNANRGIPAGYKPAWDDGRVNLQRGPRSGTGDASMNRVWTQTIPRQLIADVSGSQGVRRGFGNSIRRVVPWMSSKELTPESAGAFVQIGAFGSAENVQKNLGLLSQMGMGAVVQNAGSVQVVMAGPFAAADARSALTHLRSAGYSDAFIR